MIIYTYVCVCVCVYIYIYRDIYTYIAIGYRRIHVAWQAHHKVDQFEARSAANLVWPAIATVSFHIFKSQNFKLSVSNPKTKYVAYLCILSQMSNCQCLGRKNKHGILKIDRTSALKRNHNTRIRCCKLSAL